MDIKEILRRRSDLSTFLVHLTRDGGGTTAKARLKSILASGTIEARTMFGHAKHALEGQHLDCKSQKCVCFTETPIEHVNLVLQEIGDRMCQFKPYGIAVTKKMGRVAGVNPVWYVDITPGHYWLSNKINAMIQQALQAGNFDGSDISAITPFIEQMGSGQAADGSGYKKEFWWEREWRKVGDFCVPPTCIAFCPEAEIREFQEHVLYTQFEDVRCVDPCWSLEQTIAHLAYIRSADIDLV